MPLMHCVHTSTLRKEMFLVIVQKQQQYMTGHASFWAVSFKTLDRLLKGPTTTCCKPVRRYHQLMAGSGTKMLSRVSCQDWNATRS